MFIYLQELRDAHQAAHPAEYARQYDVAYLVAYNAVFKPFIAALEEAINNGRLNLDRLDATSHPTRDVKAEVLQTVTLAQVSGLAEAIMVAHDHGRDEGCDDAFVDAVSTVKEHQTV